MKRLLYTRILAYILLLVSSINTPIIYAQVFPLDPIIVPPSTATFKYLKKGDNQYMTRQDFDSLYKIIPNPNEPDLQPFLYKQNSWPWRIGVFSGVNFAYCGTWENTFGPVKRDNTLYNGSGLNITGTVDYFLTPAIRRLRFGIGAALGYQNYITRSAYQDYLYGLAAARTPSVARDQVTIDQRLSEDIFLAVGPAMAFTLARSRRNHYSTVFIEAAARVGVFHTQAATITAFIPSQSNALPASSLITGGALIRTVNPSSNLYHAGVLGSLAIFVPLRNNWNIGIQGQGFFTQLNYLIVNGMSDQQFEFRRKHGGFSIGIAVRRSFPHRRLIPVKSDTSKTRSGYDVLTDNVPLDPIITQSSSITDKNPRKNRRESLYMTRSNFDTLQIQSIANESDLQPFFYKLNPWPWRVGVFGGINLAYCGTWENTLGLATNDKTQYTGAGLNLSGNVDYYLTSDSHRLRFGLGTTFGYQNSGTRESYRNYLYDLAAARMPSVSKDQVTVLQGGVATMYLTGGFLGTYTFKRKAITIELGLRAGLFRTEAATISAFIPSQSTITPTSSLAGGGAMIRRVSPDARLYHGGGLMSLGVFWPFSKNWQLGIQAQGLYTGINYLIINGSDDQVTSYTRPYKSFSVGIALRRLLPSRKLVPVAE